jgi:competence protein ComEC
MKRPRALLVVLAALAALAEPVRADYLETRRSAVLKASGVRDGFPLETLQTGTLLELLEGPQQNGYYPVRTRELRSGFVYRTLVRRHPGVLPPAPGGEPAPGESGESHDPGDPAPSGLRLRVHLIDVGQGAATLFEFPCGAALIDTGGETNGDFDSAAALSAYLDQFFNERQDLNRTLDLLAITHPHIDHARNVRLLTQQYSVRNVVTNGMPRSPSGNFYSGGLAQAWLEDWAREHARLETIDAARVPAGGATSIVIDPVRCPDVDPSIRVLWGRLDAPGELSATAFANANDHSVVFRVDFGRASFLVSGDLEVDALPALLEKHRGTDALDIDVWQVSHHGSANGTERGLLDALTPEVALLATGAPTREGVFTAWAYGHPRASVIDQLLATLPRDDPFRRTRRNRVPTGIAVKDFETVDVGEAIYATGWDGSVIVTADAGGGYSVWTER